MKLDYPTDTETKNTQQPKNDTVNEASTTKVTADKPDAESLRAHNSIDAVVDFRSTSLDSAEYERSEPEEANLPTAEADREPCTGRPMQKGRFCMGLIFSTLGMSTMLLVAIGAFRGIGVNGRLSLPVVAVCMILGLMLLGGGFGVMATASPTFDDAEFERLMQSGERKKD